MLKGKSLRRALTTVDSIRVNSSVPLIQDKTELISPDEAKEMLKKNKNNRPVNWRKVEEFSDIMRRGDWKLHPQGIILDKDGNILTGQTRLWAIIYAETSVYMRVSRGTPKDCAFVLDGGRPQSARDLSSRRTERRHSPTEASIARAVCILRGIARPNPDEIASVLTEKDEILSQIHKDCKGTEKTKTLLMVLGVVAELSKTRANVSAYAPRIPGIADKFEQALLPYKASSCWNRGVSFGMAMQKAQAIVEPDWNIVNGR